MEVISNFAVFEGGDGSGTTTQLSLLAERLQSIPNFRFFATFEPTDGQIGKVIRAALKKEAPAAPQTLAMLFAADRNEHLFGKNGIIERTKQDELVICDRYALSSLVYQGIDCGDELPTVLNSRFPAPEVLIFFDIDPQIAINRVKSRSAAGNSQEIFENLDFQAKVREKYKSLLGIYRDAGTRVETIDASQSAQEVADQVWSIICQMPILKSMRNEE